MSIVTDRYPVLAREGRVYMLIAIALAVVSIYLFKWGALPVCLLAAFVFNFFRDPRRSITTDRQAVVSPASGRVVFIGETENAYDNGRKALKISVFMNVFSVHSNLIPVTGVVRNVAYFPGKFVNAALDKASSENERCAIEIRTEGGYRVHSVQIAGLIARRILCYAKVGDTVNTGERYGFIRFGSRVDIYLPTCAKVAVMLGESIDSGSRVLAHLPASSA